MKACSKCGEEKPLDMFYKLKNGKGGLHPSCKSCQDEARKKNAAENKDREKETRKIWAVNNKDVLRISRVKKREENKERISAYMKKWREDNLVEVREKRNKWNADHPERRRATARKTAAKRRNSLMVRLNDCMSSGVNKSLKTGSSKAGRHWEALVDFTIDQLKAHLEKKFKPGMSWDNYGKHWHIDHKIPKSVFNYKTPEDIDFRKCWSLKNLQPLEAKINMSKGAKLEKPFQPSLNIPGVRAYEKRV